MGFFNFGKPSIPGEDKPVNVKCSDLGKTKLTQGQATGMEFDVLSTVKKMEPCTAEEVAHNMQPPRPANKVRYILRELKAKQWIEVMS